MNDSYQNIISETYANFRKHIRSGDLLLCSGSSLFSTLIQKATNSQWSHVAFILWVQPIQRIMVLESVESIGVRAVPLSSYVGNYNGTGKPYPGKLMLARHMHVKPENINQLSHRAIDLLGYPYRQEEIVHIATRLSLHSLGLSENHPDPLEQQAFICSEYASACFRSIGVEFKFNEMGFIAPNDFATNPHVQPLCFLNTANQARLLQTG